MKKHLGRRAFLQHAGGVGVGMLAASAHSLGGADPKAPRLHTVTLEGPPQERGAVHGKTFKEPIHALLKLWKADLKARYEMGADASIQRFLKSTDFLPAIKKWTPELLDEVNGIAKGAGVDFDTMFAFQLLDEYWCHGPGLAGEHCSSLGLARRGDRPTMVAQNMDLEGFRNGFQAVLRIRQPGSKLEALVMTCPGLIALNGLNNRSVGVCCNTLSQLAYCGDGLPVAFVVRGLLQQETDKAAVDFLQRIKHASGQNYVIGGPDKVFDLECSAGKVSRFTPEPGPEIVWHTNHPLVNDDYHPAYRELLKKKTHEKNEGCTRTRLQALEKRLGKAAPNLGVDDIKTALASKDSADYPVCRPFKNAADSFTFAASIMVLSAKPELQIAPGPSDVQAYQTLTF